MPPSYGAADVFSVVSLVDEADVPTRKVERPDEEVEYDATAVLFHGLALRCVPRLAHYRVDGRAKYVRRLLASVHPDKQSDAMGQVFELVLKGEASVASTEVH